MALIRFPEGQQRSGKSGGVVFSHNRFGAYIRPASIPVNPRSPDQVAARARVAAVANAWNASLSDGQREAWDVFAAAVPWSNKFGDQVYLTGQNWFMSTNTLRLLCGGIILSDAPTILEEATPPLGVSFAFDDSAQTIATTFDNGEAWANEDGGFLIVSQGMPQNPGRAFFNGPWRFTQRIDGDSMAAPASPATGPVEFPVGAGQRCWARARVLRADGRVSPFVQFPSIVAA